MKRAPPSKKERCSALGLCLEMSPVFDFGQGLRSLRNRRLKVLNGRKKEVSHKAREGDTRGEGELPLFSRVSFARALSILWNRKSTEKVMLQVRECRVVVLLISLSVVFNLLQEQGGRGRLTFTLHHDHYRYASRK